MSHTRQTFIPPIYIHSLYFLAWLVGPMIFLGQFACDSSPTHMHVENSINDYKPPPPPKPPARFEEKGDHLFWRPEKNISRYVTVYFDNGSTHTLQVKLDEQSIFAVAPLTRKTLRTNAAVLSFDTQINQTSWIHYEHLLTPKMTYIYNVEGLWDYVLEQVQFREFVVLGGDKSNHQHFKASTFLEVGPTINYVFKPFPKSIKTTKRYNQIMAKSKQRTRLTYLSDTPNVKRRFRKLKSKQWIGVVESPGQLVLQPKGSTTNQSTLYIDSMERRDLALWINDTEVGQIARRAWMMVLLPSGEYTFEVRNRRNKVVDTIHTSLLQEKRYLWNPKGRARYQVEKALYGRPLLATQTFGMRRPQKIKARTFFEIKWDYVFQPFPKTAPVSIVGSSKLSRLTRRGRP